MVVSSLCLLIHDDLSSAIRGDSESAVANYARCRKLLVRPCGSAAVGTVAASLLATLWPTIAASGSGPPSRCG